MLPSVEDRAEELFRTLDIDGDGEITQAEFIDGYMKMHKTVGRKNKWSPEKKVKVIITGDDCNVEVNKIFMTYS